MTGRRAAGDAASVRGTTLVELLVALAIASLGVGALALLSAGVLSTFDADPAASEQQQRARAAASLLAADLARAGTGFVEGGNGSPGWGTPAVLPDVMRSGAWPVVADGSALTAIAGARSEAHARLQSPAAAGQNYVALLRPPYCASSSVSCRFSTGDDVLLTDDHGRMGTAVVRAVSPPLVITLAAPLAESWRAGTVVSVVTSHSYAVRPDPATGLLQLVRSLGAGPANPVIDFVTAFNVAWGLDGSAPAVRLAADGVIAGTTAGAVPPPLSEVADVAWPAGENCVFTRDAGGAPASRLPPLGNGVVVVPTASLGDGPWCPSAVAPTRWDADLVRVVEVRISIGVAVASAHLRPPVAPLLGGPARRAPRLVPDLTTTIVARPGRRAAGR